MVNNKLRIANLSRIPFDVQISLRRTMLKAIIGILLVCPFCLPQHFGDEAVYTINGKKALHSVSEKFLSISIDPAVLLTGLNLSDTSLQLAKHLNPAYIRIAGPSTHYVKYEDLEENLFEHSSENTANVVVTPSMWFGINEWLTSANLTPIFGINDSETTKGAWNPQSIMSLLEISDKFNLTCYWQLGYDCANKTEAQYKLDLRRFQNVLEAFPEKKDTWKIVGSDLSKCVPIENTRKVLEDLQDVVTAVVWESSSGDDFSNKFSFLPIKTKEMMWITASKCNHPVSFTSAIAWAKQIGEAAKFGYNVIFRQPRIHEMFSDTPPFWVSVLHKTLMGQNVLDVKTTTHHPQISVYAHCTRHQNNFIRSGAMTIFMINNGTTNHTIFLRFGTVLLKNTEVQNYILTSPSESDTDVYLNGEKLSLDSFVGDKMNVLPKLRRAKIMNYLSLSLPPKSIGFFVIPGARVPVCINEELEMKLLMEEIHEDQNIPFSEEVSVDVTSRFSLNKKTPTLRELQEIMAKELASDEKYYNKKKTKINVPRKDNKEVEGRNFFIERAKLSEKQRKHVDDNNKFKQSFKEKPKEVEPKRIFELELTSGEIRKILSDRAKAKAAKKNIIFTSEELEEIMDKATEKFLKNKNASIRIRKKTKRDINRDKKDINMRLLKLRSLGEKRRLMLKQLGQRSRPQEKKRERRDINMDLLKLKSEILQNKNKKPIKTRFEDKEEKIATIRQPGQTSDEFLEESEEEEKEESPLPDGDVYAQIAGSADSDTIPPTQKPSLKIKRPNLFKPIFKLSGVKQNEKKPKQKLILAEDDDDEFEDLEIDENNNYACIHEYYGTNVADRNDTNRVTELWEVGLDSGEPKKDNHLPSLANRGFSIKESDQSKSNWEDYFEKSSNRKGDDDDEICENDYDDLESDESSPLRLKRHVVNQINSEEGRIYIVVGKGYDPSAIKIDENMKEQQFKILKSRLAYKKKMDFINRKNKVLKKRNIWSENGDRFEKRYKSLTEGLKVWKPSDMLNLKNQKNRKLSKRSVDNSIENEIDNFINEIAKDSKMKPRMDKENGDYQLVFPNQDRIEVSENHGDTELKLVFHDQNESTTETNIQKISKGRILDDVWERVFQKLSNFFHGLSTKLKNICDDLLK